MAEIVTYTLNYFPLSLGSISFAFFIGAAMCAGAMMTHWMIKTASGWIKGLVDDRELTKQALSEIKKNMKK